MRKLVSAGLLCAALLCGCGAQKQSDGSAEYQLTINSMPEMAQTETEQYTRSAAAYQDTLRASEEYGMLLPYKQLIVQADGSTVERYALADQNGAIVTDAVYDSVSVETAGKYELYVLTQKQGSQAQTTCAALDGSWVIGPFYGSAEMTESGIITREYTNKGSWRGSHLFDANGETVVKTEDEILFCQDGTMLCRKAGKEEEYVWQKLDGTLLTSFRAEEVGAPEDGYVIARDESGFGVLDESGEWVIAPVYQSLEGRFGSYLIAQNADGKYGILRIDGKTIQEFEYTKIQLCDNTAPLYQLWTEDKSIVVNAANGKRYAIPSGITTQEIVGLQQTGHAVQTEDMAIVFDDIASFELKNVSALHEIGRKTVVAQAEDALYLVHLDSSAKSEAIPYVYCEPEITDALQSNTFTVRDPETGRQGIMADSGKFVLQPIYHEINVITDGYYQVRTAQFTGVVDKNGEWIVKLRNAAAD